MLVLVWTDLNYGLDFEVRINGLIYGNIVTGKSIFGGKRAVFPVNCPRNQIGHKKVLSRARGTDSPPRHCMARLLQKVLKVQVAGWFLVVNGVKFLVVGSWSGWNINL